MQPPERQLTLSHRPLLRLHGKRHEQRRPACRRWYLARTGCQRVPPPRLGGPRALTGSWRRGRWQWRRRRRRRRGRAQRWRRRRRWRWRRRQRRARARRRRHRPRKTDFPASLGHAFVGAPLDWRAVGHDTLRRDGAAVADAVHSQIVIHAACGHLDRKGRDRDWNRRRVGDRAGLVTGVARAAVPSAPHAPPSRRVHRTAKASDFHR